MIKDGEKMGPVIRKTDKVKRIDIYLAAEILDTLDKNKRLYMNISDFFETFSNKLWRSLVKLEEQKYIRFQFLGDGRLEIEVIGG